MGRVRVVLLLVLLLVASALPSARAETVLFHDPPARARPGEILNLTVRTVSTDVVAAVVAWVQGPEEPAFQRHVMAHLPGSDVHYLTYRIGLAGGEARYYFEALDADGRILARAPAGYPEVEPFVVPVREIPPFVVVLAFLPVVAVLVWLLVRFRRRARSAAAPSEDGSDSSTDL